MSETRQCMNHDMRNKQCIHVTGHSGDHEFQDGSEDRSEDIRLRFARDVRDREIVDLRAKVATMDAVVAAAVHWAQEEDLDTYPQAHMKFTPSESALVLAVMKHLGMTIPLPLLADGQQLKAREK